MSTHAGSPDTCSEYLAWSVQAMMKPGLPPRPWGILADELGETLDLRFTPTPVGNTQFTVEGRVEEAVHPHACGEYALPLPGRWRPCPVHPHACGEYPVSGKSNVTVHGSPPRLWGIRHCIPAAMRGGRFTPTPVGNTTMPEITVDVFSGSPPRLWGIPGCRSGREWGPRFTPTPVGNTNASSAVPATCNGSPPRLWGIRSQSAPGLAAATVHPHACGEYTIANIIAIYVKRFTPTPVGNTPFSFSSTEYSVGSPPRLWGIRFHLVVRSSVSSVHPHACGEYLRWDERRCWRFGSPPRLWGIPVRLPGLPPR